MFQESDHLNQTITVREINTMRDAGASQEQLDPAQDQIREFADVFGLVLEEEKSDSGQSADVFIQMLVDLRFELIEIFLQSISALPVIDNIQETIGGIPDVSHLCV